MEIEVLQEGAEDGPIHGYFDLIYANTLVLYRTILQSMPPEWQERFVACLQELDEAVAGLDLPGYFHVVPAQEVEVSSLTIRDLPNVLGDDVYIEDEEEEEGLFWPRYLVNGQEVDAEYRVLLPVRDPVPHYNRGRTKVRLNLPVQAGAKDA